MQNILWLIRKIYKNTFRKKGSWIIFFFMPMIGVLLSMMLYASSGTMPLRIGVVNQDGQETIAKDTIGYLSGLQQVALTEMTEEELNSKISAGDLDAGVILRAGYTESLYRGELEGLELRSMKGAESTAFIKAMLQQYTGNLTSIGKAADKDRDAFEQLYTSFQNQSFVVHSEPIKDPVAALRITYQAIGFLVMFMLFSASNMTQLILLEKENRTYLRLMSSPMSARAYVLSNAIVSLIFLFVQNVFTLLIMNEVLGIDPGVAYWKILLVLLVFSLVAISLALLLVAYSKSSSSLSSMQSLVIVPTCLLAGCFFPMEIMPKAVQRAAAFMPQHYVLDAITRLQEGTSLSSLGLNVAILLAFALVFSLIAIYRFGRNNDTRMFI
ncbi:ABC transporter permease [Gorillibacterium timonense]|uniref:ABC transporter permease n=1 Tax=Gorillibacterium timonense TaxID=1689269 RepID=UPI00071C2BB6|nr:ABC transporter permease [Gorillibacterium timonense]